MLNIRSYIPYNDIYSNIKIVCDKNILTNEACHKAVIPHLSPAFRSSFFDLRRTEANSWSPVYIHIINLKQ